MDKALCYAALGVGALMAFVFLIDAIAGFPFGRGPFLVFDILGLLVAAMVAYLGFNALRDIR